MSKIDTTGWKEFRLGELFEIGSAKKRFNANNVTIFDKPVEGSHPYVVRSSQNNGIRGWIIENESCLLPGNTLSFGQDTATVFYQEEAYFTGDKIKGMKPIGFELTPQIACYMLANIRKAFSGFAWGQTSFNEKVLTSMTISLPVKETEEIDYEYMEERIRELEEERIRELDAYLEVAGLKDFQITSDDQNLISCFPKSQEHFALGRLFTIKKGKRLTKADQLPGTIAFVGASAENHGITGRIGNTEHLHQPNTITVSYNGSVGEAFYQEEMYWASDDVMPYYPNFEINENIACYLIAHIKKIGKSYSYSQKWTWEKMNADLITLPILVDQNGDPILDTDCYYHDEGYIPDFDFMDRYIEVQKKLAIQSVNKLRQKEIDTAKEIVKIEENEDETSGNNISN